MLSWFWPGSVQNGGDIFIPAFVDMVLLFIAIFGSKAVVEKYISYYRKHRHYRPRPKVVHLPSGR